MPRYMFHLDMLYVYIYIYVDLYFVGCQGNLYEMTTKNTIHAASSSEQAGWTGDLGTSTFSGDPTVAGGHCAVYLRLATWASEKDDDSVVKPQQTWHFGQGPW